MTSPPADEPLAQPAPLPPSTPGPARARAARARLADLAERATRMGVPPWRLRAPELVLAPRRPAWLIYLSVLGPGLVAASAGNDVGGIATYAAVGARYGYDLLWMMVAITIAMIAVQEQCARMGAVTGKGLSDLIREQFGPRWTVVAMLCLLVANGAVIITEFVGIGAAAELFGIRRYLAVPLMGALVWWLIVWGNYRHVERFFLALTLAFFAYPVAAFLASPDWGLALRRAIVPTIHPEPEYVLLFVATVGTTITPYMQMYQQDAVVEKGITPAELRFTRLDVIAGCVFSNLIAVFVIIATAATLYAAAQRAGQAGYEIGTAEEAARALAPVAGPFAAQLFALGIYGASMLAAGVLPLATAFSICQAFGWERGLGLGFREAPIFYGLLTCLMAVGTLVALIPDLPVIRLLITVQFVNGLLLPVLLVFITRMAGDRDLMGPYVNGPLYRVFAWAITVIIAALALLAVLTSVILPLAGLG